jgi:hypothetical protein
MKATDPPAIDAPPPAPPDPGPAAVGLVGCLEWQQQHQAA